MLQKKTGFHGFKLKNNEKWLKDGLSLLIGRSVFFVVNITAFTPFIRHTDFIYYMDVEGCTVYDD